MSLMLSSVISEPSYCPKFKCTHARTHAHTHTHTHTHARTHIHTCTPLPMCRVGSGMRVARECRFAAVESVGRHQIRRYVEKEVEGMKSKGGPHSTLSQTSHVTHHTPHTYHTHCTHYTLPSFPPSPIPSPLLRSPPLRSAHSLAHSPPHARCVGACTVFSCTPASHGSRVWHRRRVVHSACGRRRRCMAGRRHRAVQFVLQQCRCVPGLRTACVLNKRVCVCV